MVDEVDGVVVSDELGVEDDGCCPEHNWDDEGNDDADVVLPLDFVVGVDNGAPMASCAPTNGCSCVEVDAPDVNGAPMGLMVIVGATCLDVDPGGIPDDADPMSSSDGCAS